MQAIEQHITTRSIITPTPPPPHTWLLFSSASAHTQPAQHSHQHSHGQHPHLHPSQHQPQHAPFDPRGSTPSLASSSLSTHSSLSIPIPIPIASLGGGEPDGERVGVHEEDGRFGGLDLVDELFGGVCGVGAAELGKVGRSGIGG